MEVKRSALLLSLLALAACSDHDHGTECDAGDPAITSLTFTPTTVGPGGDLTGTVVVENWTLTGEEGHTHTESLGPSPQADGHDEGACNTGHLHVYLDDLMTNPLTQAVTSEFVITIPTDTTLGSHTIMGRLHNADHTIYEPQVIAEVDIEVAAP